MVARSSFAVAWFADRRAAGRRRSGVTMCSERATENASWAAIDHAVVVGCGRLGSLIAGRLSAAGIEVVVVDRDPSAFRRLPPTFSGFTLAGDAVESATLRETDLAGCQLVVAATESDDVNLMVAQVARRIFQVETVIARVYDPDREPLYRRLGIDTVSPTRLTAEAVEAVHLAHQSRRREAR